MAVIPNGRKRLPAVWLKELNVSNFNLAFLMWFWNRTRIAPMWNGFVVCRSHGLQQFFFHRCKRKKHVVSVTQNERFWKKFANVPLRAANVTFTKSILCGRWQKYPVTWSAPALQGLCKECFAMNLQNGICNSVFARRVQFGNEAGWNSCS